MLRETGADHPIRDTDRQTHSPRVHWRRNTYLHPDVSAWAEQLNDYVQAGWINLTRGRVLRWAAFSTIKGFFSRSPELRRRKVFPNDSSLNIAFYHQLYHRSNRLTANRRPRKKVFLSHRSAVPRGLLTPDAISCPKNNRPFASVFIDAKHPQPSHGDVNGDTGSFVRSFIETCSAPIIKPLTRVGRRRQTPSILNVSTRGNE